MNKIITRLPICFSVLFLSIVFSFNSCDSFVEVELPKSQLTAAKVFEDNMTADAAMTDIYAKIRDKGLLTGTQLGISNCLGIYTDELNFYGPPSNSGTGFYTNTILPSNSIISLFWNNSYNQIYAANAVLEGIQASSALNSKEKAQLEGEAHFVRGLLHFYLLQLFGDIPYLYSTDYKVNSTAKRIPEYEIYNNVISDLKTAEKLLPITYLNTERIRPNSFTAKALLARVYLYQKDWENAAKLSTEVIENKSLYVFENNPEKVFLKNSTETIWQFIPSLAGKNTDEGTLFYFASGPPQLVAISQSLMDSFTANDARKLKWTTAVSNVSGTWYYASKYKENKSTASSKEYSIVLRLTEQYFIRAEARTHLNDHLGAKEDLHKIINRAGLADITSSSKEEILSAIAEERRKELFTEYGHRFFDLKRNSKLDITLASKPGWETTDRLLPVPETEFLVNPNLGFQNPGY
ncbi:RagB/SusD family nutrient uptake outer membrane protein [Flavobacterium notoginsengisoli]|uniref:RagB/SusD family nutrient uptake outer membrane protein n=1 Tax=Flavobacterium notoginsengisoli TaxID=1478199 RepID=UPI00362A1B39